MADILLSQKIAWVLFVAYLGLSIATFYLHLDFKHASSHPNLHAPVSLGGMVCMGGAMMVYQLFRGTRTRLLKYVHFVLQTIAVILLFVGYLYTYTPHPISEKMAKLLDYENTLSRHITIVPHRIIGYLLLVSVGLQYILAAIIYLYMYDYPWLRQGFAPLHGLHGMYICSVTVVAYMTGVFFLYQSYIWNKALYEDVLEWLSFYSYNAFLIVIIVLICPAFDWDLVGNI